MNKAIRDAIKLETDKAYHEGYLQGLKVGGCEFNKEIDNENFLDLTISQILSDIRSCNGHGREFEKGLIRALEIMQCFYEALKKDIHTDKGCESCKYEDEPEFTSPCVDCSRNHKDMWEAKR